MRSIVEFSTVFGVLVIALSQTVLAQQVATDQPPNVVLILADDLGSETLGCYGGTSYATPHLDALAGTGMRFRHCYSMPVCHPSRVALLTGRYPFRMDNPRWGSFPKEEEARSLAQVMQRAGYATVVAGKWQLALLADDLDQPHRMGFDEYCLFGWHEGPRYHAPWIWQNGSRRDDVADRYGPDVYCDFLIDFMTRHRDGPFLAFYSMALCHDVTDDLDKPVPFGPKGRYETYGEMVEAMDARVGRIVAALERLGLREKTLVLFTGDNGTPKRSILTAVDGELVREPVFSQWRGKRVPGGKGELTDGGTHVPLVANWPSKVGPEQVVDDLVDFSDFLPTLAQLGGASLPDGVRIDGRSFAPRLLGTGEAARTWAFSERGPQRWVRTQDWKLYNNGRLFDMVGDPREARRIAPGAGSQKAADARRQLEAAFEQLLGPP